MGFTRILLYYLQKEWLTTLAFLAMLVSAVITANFSFLSQREWEVLGILLILLLTVKGLERSGLLDRLAVVLQKRSFLPARLTFAAFFLSMFVTNDVALLVLVPLTLSLKVRNKIALVILETLAVNAGSALTPIGNPQNLFIYWFYDIPIVDFVKTIFPFVFLFFLVLMVSSFFVDTRNETRLPRNVPIAKSKVLIYTGFFVLILLIVFHLVPVWVGLFIPLFVAIFDRPSLRIDYPLLLTFLFFFVTTENLRLILSSSLSHTHHVFLLAVFGSQVISNVPAALLLAKFTEQWPALLWGVSVGGFGSLFGSLANLIAYRLYVRHQNRKEQGILKKFLLAEMVALLLGIFFYFWIMV